MVKLASTIINVVVRHFNAIFQTRTLIAPGRGKLISLAFRRQWVPGVVDLDVLVVVRLGRRSFATNVARERSLPGVYPLVLG